MKKFKRFIVEAELTSVLGLKSQGRYEVYCYKKSEVKCAVSILLSVNTNSQIKSIRIIKIEKG
jgi:hypothetical protein